MKKILVDANIIDKEKISFLCSTNLIHKFKKSLKLYASDVVLKQRLAPLYFSNNKENYNFYIQFLKNYFEHKMVDFSGNIVQREINNSFNKTNIFGMYRIEHLVDRDSIYNKLGQYDAELDKTRKFEAGNNFKKFIADTKVEISKLSSNEEWKNYCYDFVKKYAFATQQLNRFLNNQNKYNRKIFTELLMLWWEYSTVVGTLRYFNTQYADDKTLDIIENGNISKNSFLYYQFIADKYIINYCFTQDKRFDYDSPNDLIYISLMKYFDILLTDDESFMKECFNHMYPNKNKQILTLKEFVKRYK